MGQNMEGYGLELWRRLHAQYSGSDKLLQVAGRTNLQDFPACRSVKNLDHHIDEWLHLFYSFGDGISPGHAKTMFVRMIPESLRTEIYRRPDVERMELLPLIDWVRRKTLYERSESSSLSICAPTVMRKPQPFSDN